MVLIILPCRGSITPPATCRTEPTIQTTGLHRGIMIHVDCRSSHISFISFSRSATRSVIHMISRSWWIVNIAMFQLGNGFAALDAHRAVWAIGIFPQWRVRHRSCFEAYIVPFFYGSDCFGGYSWVDEHRGRVLLNRGGCWFLQIQGIRQPQICGV